MYFQYHIFVNRTQETKRQQQKDSAMEVVGDVCESEGVCEVMCDVLSDQPEHGESMETRVSEEEAARTAKSASPEEHADLSAAAHGTGNTSTEAQKPRFSYRLVFKPVCCKDLIFSGCFSPVLREKRLAIFEMFIGYG